jgi:hypothetical protein
LDEIAVGAHRSTIHFSGYKKLPDANIYGSHDVHIVTCTPIAGKREDRFLMNSPLLGYATIDEACFYAVYAKQQ